MRPALSSSSASRLQAAQSQRHPLSRQRHLPVGLRQGGLPRLADPITRTVVASLPAVGSTAHADPSRPPPPHLPRFRYTCTIPRCHHPHVKEAYHTMVYIQLWAKERPGARCLHAYMPTITVRIRLSVLCAPEITEHSVRSRYLLLLLLLRW